MAAPGVDISAARDALARGDLHTCYEAALRVLRVNPFSPDANRLAGLALLRAEQIDQAAPLLEKAHRARPADVDTLFAMGELGFYRGDGAQARRWFTKALEVSPENKQALRGLSMACRMSGDMAASAETAMRVLKDLPADSELLEVAVGALLIDGRSDEALALVNAARAEAPSSPHVLSESVFPLLYAQPDPTPLFQVLRELGARVTAACPPLAEPYQNSRDPHRRLRIGYVSRDFHSRWGPRFYGPLIEHSDPGQFEVFCYYSPIDDAERKAARSSNATWRDVAHLSDLELARAIRRDLVDVLVDLSGHTLGTRLRTFAHGAAPVQATYLGFPATTGTAGVQYRIVDAVTDPPGSESLATEELIRLRPCFLCPRANLAPEVSPPPCGLGAPFTFGSFNTQSKITREVMRVWSEALHAVPGSRLLIKNAALKGAFALGWVAAEFAKLGVDPARLDLRGETANELDHLRTYAAVDVALDPFPYNGTTTTFDALWMGVPVVTLQGQSHVGRVTSSMLSAAGFPADITATKPEYVARCAALARDPAALLRRRLTQRDAVAASPLCDGPGFAAQLAACYRGLFNRWCRDPR